MAQIREAELERLKTEVSLERLAQARGITLKRHGAELIGLCPFHDDREPSLVISPQKNLALPRRLPARRQRHRLGDEGGRRLLPACRRALARGSTYFSRCKSQYVI